MRKNNKVRVYPYKLGSRSAKALAEAMGGKVLKHVGSKYRPREGDLVVNWGSGAFPDFGDATMLNSDVSVAANKKDSFIAMHRAGVRVPEFVTEGVDRMHGRTAREAAADLQFPVVCRTKLTGHSGEGIVIANNPDELVNAPLYTQYVKKKDEYRVHVFRDEVFFIQRKARKLEVEDPNWQVRNLAGGFVFVEVGEDDTPPDVLQQARTALASLGLDFGGVDVMWNDREGRAYVLEINTACGLEERTAERYANALRAAVPRR